MLQFIKYLEKKKKNVADRGLNMHVQCTYIKIHINLTRRGGGHGNW